MSNRILSKLLLSQLEKRKKPGHLMKLSPNNPLRRPGYRFFMLFQVVTSMGGGFHFVASHWILYGETGSTSSTAWLVISHMLPVFLTNPVCGVLVDRYNRRKLLVLGTAYCCLLDLALLGLMGAGKFEPWHLFVYSPLMSVGGTTYWTALPAFLRENLDKSELLHANGLNTALMQGGYLLGAGLAGLLYHILGAFGSFSVDAAGFGIGCLGWVFIQRWFRDRKRVHPPGYPGHNFSREFKEGVSYALANKALFVLALFGLVPRFAANAVNVLLAGFCMDSLKVGPKGFGILDMSYGFGAMLAGLVLPSFFARIGSSPWLPTLAILVAAGAIYMEAASSSLVMALLFMALFGMACHVSGIITSATLQTECGEHILGRISSLVNVANFVVNPLLIWALGQIAAQEAGWLVHKDPIRDGFVVVAIFNLVVAALSLAGVYPFLRKLGKAG